MLGFGVPIVFVLIWSTGCIVAKAEVTGVSSHANPLAAVQAYVFFGETLAVVQFIGFALALGGVLLTRYGGRPTGRTAS